MSWSCERYRRAVVGTESAGFSEQLPARKSGLSDRASGAEEIITEMQQLPARKSRSKARRTEGENGPVCPFLTML